MFPFELMYFAFFVFILVMYFDIYKRVIQTFARKFNELIKKAYQRINQKGNDRDA